MVHELEPLTALARIEVADTQVANLPPAGLERPNLVGDRQNARPDQAGEAAAAPGHAAEARFTSVRMV